MGWDFRAYLYYSTNAKAEDDISEVPIVPDSYVAPRYYAVNPIRWIRSQKQTIKIMKKVREDDRTPESAFY